MYGKTKIALLLIAVFALPCLALAWDTFVIKYSPDGEELWSRRIPNAHFGEYCRIETDPNNNLFLGGYDYLAVLTSAGERILYFEDNILGFVFGISGRYYYETYTSSGYDIVAGNLSNSELWRISFTSYYLTSICPDKNGSLYIFGFEYLDNSENISYSIKKYNSVGSPLWSREVLQGNEYEISAFMQCPTESDLFVFVEESNQVTILQYNSDGEENEYLIFKDYYPNYIDKDGYLYEFNNIVSKFAPSGNILWTYPFSDDLFDVDFEFDNLGNIIAISQLEKETYNMAVVTTKLNPDGQKLWAKMFNSSTAESVYGNAFAIDSYNNVIIGGYTCPGTTIECGDQGFHTFKYDAEGNFLWSVFDERGIEINSLTTDDEDNIYVAGTWQGSDDEDEDDLCGCGCSG